MVLSASDLIGIHHLHDHPTSRASTVTNRGTPVFSLLQLMQERREDSRAGAAKCVAEGDGAATRVHVIDTQV